LCQNPTLLRIFSDAFDGSDTSSITNIQRLYEYYWNKKVVRLRTGDIKLGEDRKEMVFRIALRMFKDRTTQIPSDEIEESSAKDSLESDGILVKDGLYIRFFHQTFFEYAFARKFVADRMSILELVKEDRMNLFIRFLVIQLLNQYCFDENAKNAYLRIIEELITSDDIVPFHLRKLVIDFIASQEDRETPPKDEAQIITQTLKDRPKLLFHFLRAIKKPVWIELLEESLFRSVAEDQENPSNQRQLAEYLKKAFQDAKGT